MKLASVERIESVVTHPSADRLDLVTVLGYQCVTQRGLYKEGDVIIYVRTDTVLPDSAWCEDYKKYSPDRVKAVRLRNKWSEGIIVSFDLLRQHGINFHMAVYVGMEVSEKLGVTKFNPPEPVDENALSSILPYFIPTTKEDRHEEIIDEIPYGDVGDVTLKIDGKSATFGYKLDEGYHFVCSRTNEMRLDKDSVYVRVYKELGIAEKLEAYCKKHNVSICLRGEIYGKGVSSSAKNPHSKIDGKHFAVYSVYLIDERRYAHKGDDYYFKNVCEELSLEHVFIIEEDVVLTPEIVEKYSSVLSTLGDHPFEGAVIKTKKGSFKIINKNYDSKK